MRNEFLAQILTSHLSLLTADFSLLIPHLSLLKMCAHPVFTAKHTFTLKIGHKSEKKLGHFSNNLFICVRYF
jgi:hypothetical protein